VRFKAMLEAAAIHVECFEDLVYGTGRYSAGDGPEYHVEVFFAGLELIENRIEEIPAGNELALKQSEVAAIKFDPEVLALEMFDPSCPQIAGPVTFYPLSDAPFAEVVSCFLALNPFMAVFFFDTRLVDAPARDRPNPVVGSRERGITRERTLHGHHLPVAVWNADENLARRMIPCSRRSDQGLQLHGLPT
jgi:hypothetical protein